MSRWQVDASAVERVLAGNGSFDLLGEREQAVVMDVWAERIALVRASLNFAAEFAAAGETYSEADRDGNVVTGPSHT